VLPKLDWACSYYEWKNLANPIQSHIIAYVALNTTQLPSKEWCTPLWWCPMYYDCCGYLISLCGHNMVESLISCLCGHILHNNKLSVKECTRAKCLWVTHNCVKKKIRRRVPSSIYLEWAIVHVLDWSSTSTWVVHPLIMQRLCRHSNYDMSLRPWYSDKLALVWWNNQSCW
jgi:hypothetical protein